MKMTKTFKISKYAIISSIPAIKIYYAIFSSVILLLIWSFINSNGRMHSSGLEISTVIFLFIIGLNSFKSNFNFSQANNIPRKTFFMGLTVAVFPIALSMSVIDLIINRIYNIFVMCPTNFDMIYGSHWDMTSTFQWIQSNNTSTLFGSMIWMFSLYSMIFFLGILITLIYYRSNKPVKIVISAIPIILLMFSYNISNILPQSLRSGFVEFVSSAFGIQNKNPYMAVLSFFILISIFCVFIYLLTRKAETTE